MELAKSHMAQTVIRAPIGGMVYDLAARPGVYLNIGDLVANVGQTGRLRVRVYVDEPELGRVQQGQPVTITWDALPGRDVGGHGGAQAGQYCGRWQAGRWAKCSCTIDNPGRHVAAGHECGRAHPYGHGAERADDPEGVLAAGCERRGGVRAARRPHWHGSR